MIGERMWWSGNMTGAGVAVVACSLVPGTAGALIALGWAALSLFWAARAEQ